MNSSFPNRWSFSYLKFTKYVTNIIVEPKYKYRHQEQVTVRNHNRRQSLCLDHVNSNVYAKFLSKYTKRFKSKGQFHFVSEFEPRQNLDRSQVTFDNLFGYTLSISMCLQHFITIFHSVREIGPFSLFQNLELGKASIDDKCHFAISSGRFCQYQCTCQCLCKSL